MSSADSVVRHTVGLPTLILAAAFTLMGPLLAGHVGLQSVVYGGLDGLPDPKLAEKYAMAKRLEGPNRERGVSLITGDRIALPRSAFRSDLDSVVSHPRRGATLYASHLSMPISECRFDSDCMRNPHLAHQECSV